MAEIETFDLSQLIRASARERTASLERFVRLCASQGFVKLIGHGFSNEKLNGVFQWSREFFHFPDTIKRSATRPAHGPYRGYAGVGEENLAAISGHGKGFKGLDGITDCKESFDVGPEQDTTYPTPWPSGSPKCQPFRHSMQSFFDECAALHQRILAILEEGLGVNSGTLTSLTSEGNAELRLTHYPPIPLAQLQTGSAYRVGEHTDIGVLTLLFQDSVGGLEVEDQTNPSKFLPIESSSKNELILNVADTLQRWTHNKLRSANHRVTYPRRCSHSNRKEELLPARYSIGYFGKANVSAPMTQLPFFQPTSNGDMLAVETEHMSAQQYYNLIHEGTNVRRE